MHVNDSKIIHPVDLGTEPKPTQWNFSLAKQCAQDRFIWWLPVSDNGYIYDTLTPRTREMWRIINRDALAELRSVTCHMKSHSCYQTQVNVPCLTLTPAQQAGTRFTYPGKMEGWVDLGVSYIPRWFTCPQTHPSSNDLIVTQPGVKLTTFWSQVQRPNC